MKRTRILILSAALLFCEAATSLRAEDIAIVGDGAQKISISVGGLSITDSKPSRMFLQTLEADLERSGWFSIVPSASASIAVSGRCRESGSALVTDCNVRNRSANRACLSRSFTGDSGAPRKLAHRVADEIVSAVKNARGIASSRIVMVGATGGRKDLYMCGADGNDMIRLTRDGAPSLSPSWAPDGESVLYTSLYRGFPDIYRISLKTGKRVGLASYPGMNAGGEISPNGRDLALTLSKDGNPELYVKSLRRGRITRLTRTRYAAEASPSWSPDGKRIVFVSDQSGSPHLYVIGRDGGKSKRITFRGNENVSPDWGPRGRIAYSSRRMGRYHLCVYDPATRKETQLTADYVDHEDPSWAPDGRHIVYARTERYRSDLYILDTMGDPQVRLTESQGEWYFPAWSP